MAFSFQLVQPLPLLNGYIEKIWIMQSSGALPNDDLKLIVPNGRPLLLLPFTNGITGKMGGYDHLAKENTLHFTGMCDLPSVVDTQHKGPTGIIGIEFSPLGIYRFFHLRLKNITNRLHSLTDLVGKAAGILEEQVAEKTAPQEKAVLLQEFLLRYFIKSNADPLFDHCIQQIETVKGHFNMHQLEKTTGYSSRWLNLKFEEKLGLSPKNFGSIIRFQQYYQALMTGTAYSLRQKNFYAHYYDESHFIRDFKRFTGMPPSRLARAKNDFGKLFYQE